MQHGIWHNQNATRLKTTYIPYNKIYEDMLDRFQEYQSAQDPTKTANSDSMVQTSNSAPIHWKAPRSSYCKINFDGAIFQDLQMASIGMVIRNSSGQVIGALSDKINLPPIVDDVEAITCRKAISFALDLGVDEVCLKVTPKQS